MKNPKRYNCGNGDGMFEDKKGYFVSYKDYEHLKKCFNEICEKLDEYEL